MSPLRFELFRLLVVLFKFPFFFTLDHQLTCQDIECSPDQICHQPDQTIPPGCVCKPGYVYSHLTSIFKGVDTCIEDRTSNRTCDDMECSLNEICHQPDTSIPPYCECKPGYKALVPNLCVKEHVPRFDYVETCKNFKCNGSNQMCIQPDININPTCECRNGFVFRTFMDITACVSIRSCMAVGSICGKHGIEKGIKDDRGNEIGCECICFNGYTGEKCETKGNIPNISIQELIASVNISSIPSIVKSMIDSMPQLDMSVLYKMTADLKRMTVGVIGNDDHTHSTKISMIVIAIASITFLLLSLYELYTMLQT